MQSTTEDKDAQKEPLLFGKPSDNIIEGEEIKEEVKAYEKGLTTEQKEADLKFDDLTIDTISQDPLQLLERKEDNPRDSGSTVDENAIKERRAFEVNIEFLKGDKTRQFPNNQITTAKYNCFTFLPKNLLEQFTKMANFYFLMLALMQCIPAISNSHGRPGLLLPLSFVVGVSMIKDIIEDRKRKNSDKEENQRITLACPRGESQFFPTQSKNILVGSIIKVREDEFFPCDLILLNSNQSKGIAYVETKNLDGETNLKQKVSQTKCIERAMSDEEVVRNFDGALIECDQPNELIYQFNGVFTLPGGEIVPLEPDQVLLRGSQLRNTRYVYGVAVYTGHETKIMKNSAQARFKKSKLDWKTNYSILGLILFQAIICLFAGLWYAIWEHNYGYYDFPYLDYTQRDNIFLTTMQAWGIWFLNMMNLVPISLIVTLEITKFIQGMFIQWDATIMCHKTGTQTNVQVSNLNEELGMVHYIFSDKTGTLTQNVMDFKRFTVGNFSYGTADPREMEYAPGVTNVNFDDPLFFEQAKDQSHPNYSNIQQFIECLGLCHTIIVEEKTVKGQKSLIYNASSPDELALVNGARHFGFAFLDRDDDNNMVFDCYGETKRYKLLNVLEFTSDRKRMTVVVKTEDGRYLVICKGADSIITSRLQIDQPFLETTEKHLDEFANQGLRTLLVAYKEITEQEYFSWAEKFTQAQIHINKDKEIAKVCDLLENEFNLIGSTAIEDKLQDDVGRTIFDIKKAGIKLWVLTGDKIETAINIGYSCKLLNKNMEMFMIDELKSRKILKQITDCQAIQKRQLKARGDAVILAAQSLAVINKHPSLKAEFLTLASKADVVLACRVSPKQKAQIVQMIRASEPTKSTLAIGDGANDVNMITAANIGVGISGLEGQQAARSADYAIMQFKFLRTLLFYHGREAYRRNSYLIAYMFWKNIVYVVPIWVLGFVSFFSGTAIYDNFLYDIYNVTFTALPIMWFAVFDYEHERETLLSKPKLYRIGIKNVYFSTYVFWRWFGYACWQGALLLYLAFYSLDSAPQLNGKIGGLLVDGGYVFTVVVVFVNMKILVSSYMITGWELFFIFGSIAFYYLCYWGIGEIVISGWFGVFNHMSIYPQQYLGLFFFTAAYLLIDMGMQWAHREVARWRAIKEFQDRLTMMKMEDIDPTIERRRQTQYSHKGYAFSGEMGQDQIVTESLSTRIQIAMRNQYMSPYMMLTANAAKKINESMQDSQLSQSKTDSMAIDSNFDQKTLTSKKDVYEEISSKRVTSAQIKEEEESAEVDNDN